MNVLESWKDSLEILRPKNFKLFLLVTLNSIIQTYKILFLYLLFFIGLTVGMTFFGLATFSVPRLDLLLIVPLSFAITAPFFVGFMIILAARPSTLKKNFYYFVTYKKHAVYSFLGTLLFYAVLNFINFVLFKFGFINSSKIVKISTIPIIPLWWLCIIFFVDAKVTIFNFFLSFWRAIKMLIYNAPFWLIAYVIPYLLFLKGLFWLLKSLNLLSFIPESVPEFMPGLVMAILAIILPALLAIIPICYVTNFYTKKIHDQFNLYFGSR